jgi:hypothetical protein
LWYHTGEFAETRSADVVSGNYGVYAMIDQLIYKESSSGMDLQGMGVFLQFGWAPADRNPATRYPGAGFSYTGLLPSRDQDTLGFGASYSRLVGQLQAMMRDTLPTSRCFTLPQFGTASLCSRIYSISATPGKTETSGWAVGIRWILTY